MVIRKRMKSVVENVMGRIVERFGTVWERRYLGDVLVEEEAEDGEEDHGKGRWGEEVAVGAVVEVVRGKVLDCA